MLNKILIAALLLCSLLLFHTQSIIPDSATTFSYLQSVFEDGDMFFGDEYEEFNVPPKWSRLSNKHFPINMTPIGSAVLWTPFYLAGKLIYDHLSVIGIELDNKILTMLMFLHFGSIFYGTLSILIWFNICRKLFDTKSAVIAIFAVVFGTSFFYYYFWAGTMSHIPSVFMASVFIYVWHNTKPAKNRKWHQWMLLGAIAGMSGLIRWQDFFIAAIIIPEVFNEFIIRKKIKRFIKVSFLFSIPSIALLLLQFIIWYKIYGSFLKIPQRQHLISWFSPKIGDLFFSSYHGLFFTTPIYFLIFIGLFLLWKKDRMMTFSFVIVFLIQFYFDSVFNWWGGHSFGVRRLINCSIISAVCLTSFVSYVKTSSKFNVVSYILITISIGWAFIIGFLMFMNYIPGEEYTSYGYILRSLIFAFKNIHLILTEFILTRTPLSINKAIIVSLVFVFFIIYIIIKNLENKKKILPSPNFSILIILIFFI
ncbi:MAG: hypothetical protein KKD35_00700, partial [Elusimicrobia bacterium]|nr:hypothetical protein [Elusimicrobiota bacterium]